MRPASDLFTPSVLGVVQALLPADTRAVGGAVRALLTNQPMAHVDIDLATTATPDEIRARLKTAKMAFRDDGARWGSFEVMTPDGTVDVTSLRVDTYLPGSRYPSVAWTTDWLADAPRRDFTINAVYLAPNGDIIDPYGGGADIQAGLVRFIGEPAVRLREDPLRLLRFFRFCGTYGLTGFTEELKPGLMQAIPALKTLSRARVNEELAKLALTPHAVSVQKVMGELGIVDSTPPTA